MPVTLAKPVWWNNLAAYYGFANDGLPTLTPSSLVQTLQTYVAPNLSGMVSPEFLAMHDSVLKGETSSKAARSEILISETGQHDLVLGYGGADYLSAATGDDIVIGGSDNDIINPGQGIDLVIGGLSGQIGSDSDTVTYAMAMVGINVNAPLQVTLAPASVIGTVHSFTWDDVIDAVTPKIKNFAVGPGGDALDVSALLQHVGYKGTDPVADGFIRVRDMGTYTTIQLDPDGFGGVGGRQLVKLMGIHATDFTADNLVIAPDASGPVILPGGPGNTAPSDLTIVSQDGHGSYDLLYSVENIMGSDLNDVIHGRDDVGNILYGGLGNDALYGEGGNDTLIGGAGNDSISGDAGDDLLLIDAGSDQLYGGLGADTFKFTGAFLNDVGHASATIWDFRAGTGGDRLDVSELLSAANYHGTNPVADGVITIVKNSSNTLINFDADGFGGADSPVLLATLKGVSSKVFSAAENLITHTPSILYTSVLGQSNASGLSLITNGDSGISHLENGLKNQTGFSQVVTLLQDEKNQFVNLAVGGSTVDGDAHNNADRVWWYPDEGKPGEILVRAVDLMIKQIADLRAQGAVTPTIVWGQGESEANSIGTPKTEAGRLLQAQRYMDSTRAVFDYIKAHVGSDVQFYIMQTGRFSTAGALAEGQEQHTIDKINLGLDYLHHAQQQLALEYNDIHLAVNYADLPLLQEVSPDTPGYDPDWITDSWHTALPSRHIVGDRLADFIALDMGQDHVLDNPGPYPRNLLADLTIHADPGMAIDGNASDNIIAGTDGNDTIHGMEGNDILIGGTGQDVLYGDAGSDVFYFHPSVLAEIAGASENPALDIHDTIVGFETGEGGDTVDISALLTAAGYIGADPVADGMVSIAQDGADTVVSFDADGSGTAFNAVSIARLTGIDAGAFDLTHNLVTANAFGAV